MAWRLFFSGVAVFGVTLVLYIIGLAKGFVLTLWWYDIPLHVLGGMLAGLIGMWFFAIFGRRASYTAALCGAIVLGILVEVAEFSLGLTYSPFMSYPVDVLKDLCNDVIGGLIAAYTISRVWLRK